MRIRAIALFVALVVSSFSIRPVAGGQVNYVTDPTDFAIVVVEETLFDARSILCYPELVGYCANLVDSHLWLFDSTGTLIAANDDSLGEYGWTLASHISIELAPGEYRLRAGQCCGDPDRTWGDGRGYYLETNLDAIPDGSPSPSVEPSPEPSPSPTETPTVEPSITPEPSSSPSPEPSPSVEPSPSPSSQPTSTPTPTVAPPSPIEPSPSPTETPSVEPSPTEVIPTPTPTDEPPIPTEPPFEIPNPGEAIQAVGEAIAAVTRLGADLSPTERERVAKVAIPAVIISQVGAAVAAAATSNPKGKR